MTTILRFEVIHAWQTARQLTKYIYQISDKGSFQRDFGLRDQIRRASVSVMSIIAEGFESQTQLTFIRYLGVAKSSSGEVRSQLYLALDLMCISEEEFKKGMSYVILASQQIYRFIEYLRKRNHFHRTLDS